MNYLEWSNEYTETAEKLNEIIIRLKNQRKKSGPSKKKELDQKISQYRICYGECMQTAALLRERHRGVA